MVFFLVGDVFKNPGKILFSNAHHAVSALPDELPVVCSLMVHIVDRSAFEVPDQVADRNERFDVHSQVNTSFCSTSCVKIDAPGSAAVIRELLVGERLYFIGQKWPVVFYMPVEMQIDLVEDMTGHDRNLVEKAG